MQWAFFVDRHSPRASSVTLEKPFPFPGTAAGLPHFLNGAGWCARLTFVVLLVRRLPACHLAGEAALPFFISVQDLSILVAFSVNAAFTLFNKIGGAL